MAHYNLSLLTFFSLFLTVCKDILYKYGNFKKCPLRTFNFEFGIKPDIKYFKKLFSTLRDRGVLLKFKVLYYKKVNL